MRKPISIKATVQRSHSTMKKAERLPNELKGTLHAQHSAAHLCIERQREAWMGIVSALLREKS